MTNIDRATHAINETYADEYVKPHMTPPKVAQALADAGLLMPDLPEPEEEDYYGSNVWRVRTPHEHVGVRQIGGYIQSSIVGTYGPEEAREAALALLAAADYAERHHHESE